MNYFNLGIIALSVLILGLGFLIGFGRGMKRSLLRTIIMIVCFVIAFFCKGFVVNIIKGIEIDGQTISELISSSLGEDLSSLSANINGLVDGLLNIIVYLLLVLVLHLLTLAIVYPICKIFVKKPPKGKKKRLFGGLIGFIMGLIICICSIAPLTGLLGDVADVATSVFELTESMPSSSETPDSNVAFSTVVYADDGESKDNPTSGIKDILDKIGVLEYKDSFIGKTYSFVGGWYYNIVSTYEVEGKKTNIHTEVGAISGAVKLAGSIVEIMDEDFINKISEGDFEDLSSTMKKLDEVKDSMTDEQIEALQDLLTSTADSLLKEAGGEELPIDLSKINLKEISFEAEGKLLEDFMGYQDVESPEDIKIDELISDLSKSTLILPLAADMDLGIELEGEQKEEVLAEIAKVTDPKAKEQLEKLFGLSND
ncbi:MAG: CvpA family protein [Firmicutes bacterium]|nr:CvpA family protein [Candidatus Caballimonas caccae]